MQKWSRQSPYEVFAVGTEGRLSEECCHELVPVDLMDSTPHGAASLAGHKSFGFLLEDPIFPRRDILGRLAMQLYQHVKFPVWFQVDLEKISVS